MTFDELKEITYQQDFVLTSGSVGSKEYVFENSSGNKLHIRNLNGSASDKMPMWTVDLDGDRVQFNGPSQIMSVSDMVKDLVAHSIEVLQNKQ